MTGNGKEWWGKRYGDSDFGREYARERLEATDLVPTAEFLTKAMDLKPGDVVFDQCCGGGPVSLALADKGITVFGVDQAQQAIALAQQGARDRGHLGHAFFTAADAFEYTPDKPCDAAINWSTSCGYSRDDDQNIKMFQRAYDSLKPGGRFAVQYMHIPPDHKNFSFDRSREINGQTVQSRNDINYDEVPGMSISRWTNKFSDGHSKTDSEASEMRAYSPEELRALAEKAGFVDVQLQGDLTGKPLTADAHNVVMLARKPG